MSDRQREAVRLPLAAGGELDGLVSFTGDPGPDAVLYVHGFGSTYAGTKAAAVEDACARRGWTFAAFDFRGHGKSAGSLLGLRGSGLQEDLGAAREFLAGRGVRRLFPFGSSMGGWAAAWFALAHPEIVPACALVAPAFDFFGSVLRSLTPLEQEDWRRTGRLRVKNEWLDVEVGYGLMEERDAFTPGRLAAGWATPVLIFHGMCDDTVPYADSVAFAEATACPDVELRLYRRGDHRLLDYKEEMAEAACAFFARRGAAGPAGVV
jgi:alpha-beta hydrolase superfamily lysophospholipase